MVGPRDAMPVSPSLLPLYRLIPDGSRMIYFFGWVLFIVAVILVVPIVEWLERRQRAPKVVIEEPVEEEEEIIEEIVEEEEGIVQETELEKRLRRLRIISESLSQEEMHSHAKATLELATMLQTENRLPDADQALEILTSQPGIGDRYRVRALTKHAVVLRELDRMGEFEDSQSALREVKENLQREDPETAESVIAELTPEESELFASV